MQNHVNIHIDDKEVTIIKNPITGSEFKQQVDIPLDVLVFRKIKEAADEEIQNESIYILENGMKFYSGLYKPQITIIIDHKSYTLNSSNLTGAALKALANIPTDEYKLVREEKHGADLVIEDGVSYEINDKDEFFKVPKGIQNGGQI